MLPADGEGIDFDNPGVYADYFENFYDDASELGVEDYKECFENGQTEGCFEFRSYAHKFKLIENGQKSIIVRYRGKHSRIDSAQLIEQLNDLPYGVGGYRILRQLQRFTVGVSDYLFIKLINENYIHELRDGSGIYVQIEPELYVPGLGINPECKRSPAII
jgi:hypothetical protein